MSMRFLFLDAYFEPESTAYTHLEKDLIEKIISEGNSICVICPKPTRGISDEVAKKYSDIKYESLYGGRVAVHRFWAPDEGKNPLVRAFRYFWCNLRTYQIATRLKNVDAVFSNSTPPTQGALSVLTTKRLSSKLKADIPFIFNLQDIFPDSLVSTGMTSKGSIIWKIGRKIENFTYRNANKIILISEAFKSNIIEKGVPEEKIAVVSNWIDDEAVQPVKKEDNTLYEEFNISREKFTVLYAGNFGAAQGAEVVLESAARLKDNGNIQFVIFGGGAGFEKARLYVDENKLGNVIINPLLPAERVPEVYSLGDVALITCKKGVGNSGMPSKTWSIMACNTPIIASFDLKSELAEIISDSNTGACVEPENTEALTEAILNAFSGKTEVNKNGREYVLKNASKKLCTQKYSDELINAVKSAQKE